MPAHADYQHHGSGMLRATAHTAEPHRWPDPDDEHDCRRWLTEAWNLTGLAAAVCHASPVLADRVATILRDDTVPAKDVRRATLAVVRYALRRRRPTPFGLFSGVAPISVGATSKAHWGERHRAVGSADTNWLHPLIRELEDCPGLLALLDVRFTDIAEVRGRRLVLPGQNTISIRDTIAVRTVRDEARTPVQAHVLADKLSATFPQAGSPIQLLTNLVRNGFLVTSLRAPSTVTDPLEHVLDQLRPLPTDTLPVAGLVRELDRIQTTIRAHNENPNESARCALADQMRAVHNTVRVPLSVDLRLDAKVRIPGTVATDMERGATVLARLVRETTGTREWRDYMATFRERYGAGALISLRDLLNPDSGLGLPRGYPGAGLASDRHVLSERDEMLLRLASGATARGDREIELDDDTVDRLEAAGGGYTPRPPHLDLGARIHAPSRDSLDRGDYTLTLIPGRVAGTFTGRFTNLVPEAELDAVSRVAPTITDGAVPAQLSFPPIYPSAENICRVPAHLPDSVSIGEHTTGDGITVDDLAVTVTNRRMHLVSLSRGRVVEPQVLHALAPKQQPPLARFVGELTRAHGLGWIGIDWGAAAALPFRPRLRYGRVILCPAMWRITASDHKTLDQWRTTWNCPARVELRDFDQRLPLDLDLPAHRAILLRHLRQNGEAVLLETPEPCADGWLEGHPHSVVLPLTSRRQPEPGPPVATLPLLSRTHGHAPLAPSARWLYARLYLSAQQMDTLLVDDLPVLLDALDDRDSWFVRFPRVNDGDDPDHLRLRIRIEDDADHVATVLGQWADRLRADGMLAHLSFDTYFPETARYLAMPEAEAGFVADSRLVLAKLTHFRGNTAGPTVITALSLFDMAAAFLGDRMQAADWLHRNAPPASPDRALVTQTTRLARGDGLADLPGWSAMADIYHARARALATHRAALPDEADTDRILHSLLHMHHNRVMGADRDNETVCLRLARQASATWRACHGVAE